MEPFVHLHNHSMGSLLDGFSTPEEIAKRAKELGQPAVALTDHGSLACALKFYQACVDEGVKPLIGVEAYLCDDLKSRDKDSNIYHIGLIAMNYSGLNKLFRLSEVAWTKGFYKKPRIDLSSVITISKGRNKDIIALSGCIDGYLTQGVDSAEEAERRLENLLRAFEHLFIEVQPWNSPEVSQLAVDIAARRGLPVVATADAHYARPEDAVPAEVALICSQLSSMKHRDRERAEHLFMESRNVSDLLKRFDILWPSRKLRFSDMGLYMMSRSEMEDRLRAVGVYERRFLDDTVALSDMCDVEIETGANNFPRFDRRLESDKFLRELALEKLEEKGLSNEEYMSRLMDELDVVIRLGFSDYFLVIWDMVHVSRSRGIMVGPGRGSVAGSLLAYVLGITEVDPIKFGLTFWRFLSLDVDYDPKFRPIPGTKRRL